MQINAVQPRGIAVVDVGYTNTKVILFAPDLRILAERKIDSPHRKREPYNIIDVEPMLDFFAVALQELDAIASIDRIVTSAHGACIVSLKADGSLAVPIMDYMSKPPESIVAAYRQVCPPYAEVYSPLLPLALTHAMQLFWQQRALPEDFAKTTTILPLMQYVAMRLGGKAATEISSMSCQTHLLDTNTGLPSTLSKAEGWADKFAPRANAWDVIGELKSELRGDQFRGRGLVLAGVHDSNANYLRYLAGGMKHFTLLSTGTWIIAFNKDCDRHHLDSEKDTVVSVDVFGSPVACSRFFGGKEFEILSQGASPEAATPADVVALIGRGTMALPSFTDSGGPVPNSASRGQVVGNVQSPTEQAALATLYCALMVSEQLDAIQSKGDIIVDGPFSQNGLFLSLLATLRTVQKVFSSTLRDGTAAGAACLALMPNGLLPHIDIEMTYHEPMSVNGLQAYQANWRQLANNGARP